MAKKVYTKNQYEKKFVSTFEKIACKYDSGTVWTDFVNMMACEISNAVDWGMREERGKLYVSTAAKYPKGDMDLFVQLGATLMEALNANPAQDFLGNLYMLLGLNKTFQAQIFTPWAIATAMSRLPLGQPGFKETVEKKGFASICDPACGAGGILLAIANEFGVCTGGGNFQEGLLLVGQDIDRTVAQMCYIQMSLAGCAGYVIVGNSLTHPPTGDVLLPCFAEGMDTWITPRFFMEPWVSRVGNRLAELIGRTEGECSERKPSVVAETAN